MFLSDPLTPRVRTFTTSTIVAGLALASSLVSCTRPAQKPDGTSGPLAVGQPAPDVVGRDVEGREVRLSAQTGPVVVYFYPKDGTPGCTKEACAFRDVWGQYQQAHVAVIGVSTNSAEQHAKFLATRSSPSRSRPTNPAASRRRTGLAREPSVTSGSRFWWATITKSPDFGPMSTPGFMPPKSLPRRTLRNRCSARRVVVQVRPKPALDLSHGHAFARRVVRDLVAVDLAEREVPGLGVREIEAAHARAGPHRERLGDQHAGVLLDVEQLPERALFGVIGAGRIAGGGTDAAVLLVR